MLSGEAGDFVTAEIGLYRDLLTKLRWGTLYRQIAIGGSREERGARLGLFKNTVRELTPRPLVSLWDLKNLMPSAHPPRWLPRDL